MNDYIAEVGSYSCEINNGLDERMASTYMESQPLGIENKIEAILVKNFKVIR